MKNSKFRALTSKKLVKSDREQAVLLGLVELYLKTAKPIGSSTLQEHGFESLSSATIRNYFSKMEKEGYLKQQHTSGGRTPTTKALRLYVDTYLDQGIIEPSQEEKIFQFFEQKTKKVSSLIQETTSLLSELSQSAVFISSPRFDQDFVQDVRLIDLESKKVLAVVMTNFGLIHTEAVYVDLEMTPSFMKQCETYFRWRLNLGEKPLFDNESEAKVAVRIYNEVMVRHVVGYANFPQEDLFKAGLSKLLSYPEFNDPMTLTKSLSLFEDDHQMRRILRETCRKNQLSTWIAEELRPFTDQGEHCAIIAVPYKIHQIPAGAFALLGPSRMAYRNLFALAKAFSEELSEKLTESIYKHKISFRHASKATDQIASSSILLENQRDT